ncbi:competence type IV pilus ATPase ComGA [Priestia taiwanensis]|nr:competence type IV pilus ATPase ComGA [Priestia taiwanensis]
MSDLILNEAWRRRASDIHFIIGANEGMVKYRIDGELLLYKKLDKVLCRRLISHFKFLAAMDIGEQRRPQGGTLTVQLQEDILQLRLSTLPNASEESLVLRIHPQNKRTPLTKLSLFPRSIHTLSSFLHHSHGLLILTGATGCGKTTTVYSLLEEVAKRRACNIITLEDPIEQRNETFIQVQVNEKAGINFQTGLRAILRHDPDIVMIGEIRDEYTAKIAIQASLTGHLVLTTLHTHHTKGAIYRLMELGISLHDIEQTLVGIVSQRLVKVICPYCGEECSLYCQARDSRRLGVYEILYGYNLKQVIREARGEEVTYSYMTLPRLLRKAYGLGYVTDGEIMV